MDTRRKPSDLRGARAWVALLAALGGAAGCSASGELELATIRPEGGPIAPEAGSIDRESCTPETVIAYDVGVDLYFVLEHSNEMDPDAWIPVVSALNAFFSAESKDYPDMRGMGAGFALYPVAAPPSACTDLCPVPGCTCLRACGCWDVRVDRQGACSCNEWPTSCDAVSHSKPDFEIARLSDQQQAGALLGTISRSFDGDPAIRFAIEGSLLHRAAWEQEPDHEGRRITQVLVVRNMSRADCDHSFSDAERALSGPGKPKTYVVAVNDFDEDFDRLAVAGGTVEPIAFVTYPNNKPNPFIEVAKRARLSDGRCEYLLPNGTANIDRVNLATSDGTIIPKVDDRAACARADQGWFYDPRQSTRIIACENTCNTVLRPLQTGSANLQIGCPTIPAVDARQ